MTTRYSGALLRAPPGSYLDKRSNKLPATTTIVENYIGEASYREHTSRQQSSTNRHLQMAMAEAQISEKLRLLRKYKKRKFHRIMAKGRELAPIMRMRFKRRGESRLRKKVCPPARPPACLRTVLTFLSQFHVPSPGLDGLLCRREGELSSKSCGPCRAPLDTRAHGEDMAGSSAGRHDRELWYRSNS
jgi:hypothetical protein